LFSARSDPGTLWDSLDLPVAGVGQQRSVRDTAIFAERPEAAFRPLAFHGRVRVQQSLWSPARTLLHPVPRSGAYRTLPWRLHGAYALRSAGAVAYPRGVEAALRYGLGCKAVPIWLSIPIFRTRILDFRIA